MFCFLHNTCGFFNNDSISYVLILFRSFSGPTQSFFEAGLLITAIIKQAAVYGRRYSDDEHIFNLNQKQQARPAGIVQCESYSRKSSTAEPDPGGEKETAKHPQDQIDGCFRTSGGYHVCNAFRLYSAWK